MQYKSSCSSIFSLYQSACSLWSHLIQKLMPSYFKKKLHPNWLNIGVNNISNLWWLENPTKRPMVLRVLIMNILYFRFESWKEHAHMEIDIRAYIMDSPSGWWVLILLHLSRSYNFGFIPNNHNVCFLLSNLWPRHRSKPLWDFTLSALRCQWLEAHQDPRWYIHFEDCNCNFLMHIYIPTRTSQSIENPSKHFHQCALRV